MKSFSVLDWVAFVLVVVGGLNWGLVGLFDFNLVDSIFSGSTSIARIVYTLVGIGAIYMLVSAGKMAKKM